MRYLLKAMLIAGALGTSGIVTAPAANAQYYQRPGVSVYIGVDGRRHYRDRDYYRHRNYHRSYYDRDDWRLRNRCHRWNGRDCGHHYGWRNDWRRSSYRHW
jgi:hypothetical protein